MIKRQATIAVILLLVLAVIGPGLAVAHPSVILDDTTSRVDLTGRMEVLRDDGGGLTIDDMERPEIAQRFQPLPGDLAAGYDRSAFWLRFHVQRVPTAEQRWFLEVRMPYLDYVTLFVPEDDGRFGAVSTGDRTPFSTRPVPYRTFVFEPRIPSGGSHSIYLRVQTTSAVSVSASLWSKDDFMVNMVDEYIVLGLINGCIFCIFLYSVFTYRIRRDSIYAYYMIYITASQFLYASSGGLLSQYIVPNAPLIADAAFGASFCIVIASGFMFGVHLMDLGRHYPRFQRPSRWIAAGFVLAALSVLIDRYYVISNIVQATSLVLLVLLNVLAMLRMLKGDRAAQFFLAAFLVYLILIAMLMLRGLGLYVAPASLNILAQAVAVPHMLLLSLGLLHRSVGIDASRLEMSRRAERELEARVAQRTIELADSNTTLATEITVRRAAEERLRESERQVRAILDAAPFPMIVAGFPDGALQFVNQPASELLNLAPAAALGMRTEDFYANPSERKHMLMKLAETGCILGAELQVRRHSDGIRWVLLSAVRFTYRDHDAILICLNDISTRKRLEETLRQASLRSEMALEASRQTMREQRNFLSMVSHEFRVPLAIIEAASQLLGIYTRADDEAQDEVAKIGRAVRRMSELIDVCLADDRLESASWSMSVSEVDLHRLLGDLCDDKRPFVGERALTMKPGQCLMVEADATMLRIGFSNLIDNALKFSPPSSPIEIHVGGDGEGVMVSVTDHGPGIALDEQPHIFEKFYRSTKSDRVRGAGLGLYIVRRIIELHGGSIAVNSLPGQGATFVVWLPISRG